MKQETCFTAHAADYTANPDNWYVLTVGRPIGLEGKANGFGYR